MKKMSKEAQMQANGGKTYHYAYCNMCGKEFKAIYFWQGVEYVKELGTNHCYANGGPNKGHRYIVLY